MGSVCALNGTRLRRLESAAGTGPVMAKGLVWEAVIVDVICTVISALPTIDVVVLTMVVITVVVTDTPVVTVTTWVTVLPWTVDVIVIVTVWAVVSRLTRDPFFRGCLLLHISGKDTEGSAAFGYTESSLSRSFCLRMLVVELQIGLVYMPRFETMRVVSTVVRVFKSDTVETTVKTEVVVDVWVMMCVFVSIID